MMDIAGQAARFEVVVTLLLGVIALLGIVGRIVYRVTSNVYEQLEAIRANTKAVRNLTISLHALEETMIDKIATVEQKVDAVELGAAKSIHNHIESIRKDILERK